MPSKNTALAEKTYATLYIRADHTSRNHTRQTYRLIEYLGDIGGLIQIILIAGSFLVGFIIERQFNAAMVSETYQIQRYTDDQTEFYSSSINQFDRVRG